MIKQIFLFLVFCLLHVVAFSQKTSDAEWDHYLNAIFLPENSTEQKLSAKKIRHPQLKELASPRQQNSDRSEKNVAAAADQAPAASRTRTSSMVESMEGEPDNMPAALLPEIIANEEKNPEAIRLSELYDRYHKEFLLHDNVYGYARTMLESVAPKGWLIVHGHLDTYPIRALQLNEGLRSDVTVVNLNWLMSEAGYRSVIASKLPNTPDWTLPLDEVSVIRSLHQQLGGKIHLSMTLSPEVISHFSYALHPSGLVFSLQPTESSDHHKILSNVDWNQVTSAALPEYVKALQQNYIAALLIHQRMELPQTLGAHQREMVLEKLYDQNGMRSAGQKYLESR